jgi:Methyltransferase domain
MLENLRAIDLNAADKVQCFDTDASDVDIASIEIHPMVAFIDGEHTRKAVNSDFDFCLRVVATGGVILFHDFWIIYRAIFDTLRKLRERDCLAYLIEDNVFGIFLDPVLVREDEYLRARYKEHRHYHRWVAARRTAAPFTPKFIKSIYRSMRATLHSTESNVGG